MEGSRPGGSTLYATLPIAMSLADKDIKLERTLVEQLKFAIRSHSREMDRIKDFGAAIEQAGSQGSLSPNAEQRLSVLRQETEDDWGRYKGAANEVLADLKHSQTRSDYKRLMDENAMLLDDGGTM